MRLSAMKVGVPTSSFFFHPEGYEISISISKFYHICFINARQGSGKGNTFSRVYLSVCLFIHKGCLYRAQVPYPPLKCSNLFNLDLARLRSVQRSSALPQHVQTCPLVTLTITFVLVCGFNKIRRPTWNTIKINSLKFDHFNIFLFVFEPKIHTPKSKLA